jgi:hypothetical protein
LDDGDFVGRQAEKAFRRLFLALNYRSLFPPPNDKAYQRQWSAAELPSGAAPCSPVYSALS